MPLRAALALRAAALASCRCASNIPESDSHSVSWSRFLLHFIELKLEVVSRLGKCRPKNARKRRSLTEPLRTGINIQLKSQPGKFLERCGGGSLPHCLFRAQGRLFRTSGLNDRQYGETQAEDSDGRIRPIEPVPWNGVRDHSSLPQERIPYADPRVLRVRACSRSHPPLPWSPRPSRSSRARGGRSLRPSTCAWRRCPSWSRSWAGARSDRANRPGQA
jgi:hypothetical protein